MWSASESLAKLWIWPLNLIHTGSASKCGGVRWQCLVLQRSVDKSESWPSGKPWQSTAQRLLASFLLEGCNYFTHWFQALQKLYWEDWPLTASKEQPWSNRLWTLKFDTICFEIDVMCHVSFRYLQRFFLYFFCIYLLVLMTHLWLATLLFQLSRFASTSKRKNNLL
jgi:hypothetical protein